jgi:rod shape-determining protein MreD
MTFSRAIAALAAMLTAMLVQAALIAPLTLPIPVCLPAVVVAAVAMVDGAGVGMAFGFTAGLLADLASVHPAGVLALCWLVVGLTCGLAADRVSVRRDAAIAACVSAVAASTSVLMLTALHADGATAARAVSDFVPTVLGDALLALLLVPIARGLLGSGSLRRAQSTEPPLLLGAGR